MKRGNFITTINGEKERLHDAPVNVRKPVREPNLQADVLTPASTASAAALISFLIVITFFIWQLDGRPMTSDAMFLAVLIGLCVWLAVFFWSIGWIRKTIHMVETVVHLDIDGDEQVGEPGHPYTYSRFKNNSKLTKEKSEFDKWKEGFYKFLDYCYEYGTTTVTLRRGGFTDNQIDSYRSYLMSMGIAAWRGKNRKEGWEVVVDELEAQEILAKVDWVEREKQGL